nr:heparin lyase I family protein [Paraburkholderia sp. Ac-20347]
MVYSSVICTSSRAERLNYFDESPLAGNEYRLIYREDWSDGISKEIKVQRAKIDDIKTISEVGIDNALRVTINKSEDFSRVANGKPRAEIILPTPVRFLQGHDYIIRWSTKIPLDFGFYTSQAITQMHQEQSSGSPPLMLALTQRGYVLHQRGASDKTEQVIDICCALKERGRWVFWELHYRPGADGKNSVTNLKKDGETVVDLIDMENSYPNDNAAYFKLGIYLPGGWKSSKMGPITLFYGPVSVWERIFGS